MIAFIGSVFSPYYAWARRRGAANPLNHCAMNVVLYGPRGKRWAMTERPSAAVRRAPDALSIGPSSMSWDGNSLTIEIDEVGAPLPNRIRGRVRLYPAGFSDKQYALDAAASHHWGSISPCSHVEVELDKPALRWSGSAYLDSNRGDIPLEKTFIGWNWSRAKIGRDTAVLYDVVPIGPRPSDRRSLLALRNQPPSAAGERAAAKRPGEGVVPPGDCETTMHDHESSPLTLPSKAMGPSLSPLGRGEGSDEGLSLALRFDPSGGVTAFDPPPRRQLPSTGWRIRRETRADADYDPKVLRTLEDAPFYARSVLSTRLLGEPGTAIHESLSLDRFDTGLVRAMLPFRMPRWPL